MRHSGCWDGGALRAQHLRGQHPRVGRRERHSQPGCRVVGVGDGDSLAVRIRRAALQFHLQWTANYYLTCLTAPLDPAPPLL